MEKSISCRRIPWIDTLKALLIISVVLGHSNSPIVTYIYLFHMPAFFMIAGYTYRGDKYDFWTYVKRKILTVFVPAILINVVYIFLYSLVFKLGYYNIFQLGDDGISIEKQLKLLVRQFGTVDLGGATWVLFVLFEVEILARLLNVVSKLLKNSSILWITLLAMGGLGYWIIYNHYLLPYYLDLMLIASGYFGIGIVMERRHVLQNIDKRVMLPFSIVMTVFFGSFYFKNVLPMNWPTRLFANLFVQVLSSLSATFVVYSVAIFLDQLRMGKILRWLGQHTYCILVLHFAAFRLFFAIGVVCGRFPITTLQNLTPTTDISSNGNWIIITAFTIFSCGIVAWCAEKSVLTDYLFNARISKGSRKNIYC